MKKKIIIGIIAASTVIGGAVSIKAISENSKNNKVIVAENKNSDKEIAKEENENSDKEIAKVENEDSDKEVAKDDKDAKNKSDNENKKTSEEGNKSSIKEEAKVTNNTEFEAALNKAEETLNLGKFQKALDIINSITFTSDIDDLNWRMEHLKGNIDVAIYDEEIINNAENYLKNGDYKNAGEMISRVKGVVIESHEKRIKKVVDSVKINNNEFKNFTYEDAVNRLRNFIGDNYNFEMAQENEDITGEKTYYITAMKKNSTYSMMYIVGERGEIRQGS